MKTFIKKNQFNYIKRCLNDLANNYKSCVDINVVEASKAYTQDKILNLFTNLSEEEREILNISKLKEASQIDSYLADLDNYVYGMATITSAQVSKLFKKEKKLKLPELNQEASKKVYLGWVDKASNKLFVAYNMDEKLIGMACRITNGGSSKANICSLCNCIHVDNEVIFVSPICKVSNAGEGGYKSIGFSICADSEKCNERIESVDNLEKILKDVNNIK
ncbi:FusB/FusC family EF-G-binding protein [Clostridium manihotivorum]|uniref:Elongation factor G-binding protein n=1 Tax=Clostridium manihotivorum TaxID=2320868 RepID=A0A3R5U5F3_9CLOT|nr:FusB/FusC family EF-G-binding protein [Clostridium manihotivorum]QAA32142.1 elongation factor G-binding protein [Clostridium manihotivorum]